MTDSGAIIERRLDELTRINSPSAQLTEAMRYSLLGGGKRVRGRLVLAACEAVCGNYKEALDFACAVEMIHAFSLIHDDLPAMDDDDMRRGKPSCHVEYGEATAILAGDALLALSFEVMANKAMDWDTDLRYVRALRLIANASGVTGMAGGQALDMENEQPSAPDPVGGVPFIPQFRDIALGRFGIRLDPEKPELLDRLKTTHAMKTGALIKASVMAGLIIGGADNKVVRLGEEFGGTLGMWFQIQDDILDAEGSSDKLGKSTGMDENKLSFVSLMGLDGAKEAEAEYAAQSEALLVKLAKAGLNVESLRSIVDSLHKRDN
ncbi:MAG: polyprenyl synthetase family protein [Oscillospiraceae bacterium]|jgi:geranylgeranyl diphosphate synthase type II|nr:polyprenyl synthetase family protein [Oscillospiraceae bacterium]